MLTNEQFIDSMIVDCNDAVKQLVNGQYLAWCATMANMDILIKTARLS